MSDVVLYEVENHIATVTLNRPERLNAINVALDEALNEALKRAEADPDVRCAIVQGAGRAFSAGADTKRDASSGLPRDLTAVEDRDRLEAQYRRWMQIWDLKIPVIAKVHGYCLGRATQLAIMCDITYVAEDTIIGAPQLPLGAGWNSVFWAWHLGPKKAKEIFLPVGDTITGAEAAELGIFNAAFPADQLDAHVDEYARKLARVPKDLLGLEKLAINKTQDIQGFREAIAVGFEIDVVGHLSETVIDVNRRIRENGLRPTIESWQAGEF